MSDLNIEMLEQVANILKKNPRALMGSRWQNCETETIATQAICSCYFNHQRKGEAFTWAGKNLFKDQFGGVKNYSGLSTLLNEDSVVLESYEGGHMAPEGIAQVDGKYQILRVTNKLLEYVYRFTSR